MEYKDARGGATMDTNGWKIIHGLSNKQGVECANIPIEGEKIGWGK
jgi:hypothetical protein